MISRSDWEPLPPPTLSPFARARPGTFLRVGFFTAAVWCVPALLRVPLVHSLINHFRQKNEWPQVAGLAACSLRASSGTACGRSAIETEAKSAGLAISAMWVSSGTVSRGMFRRNESTRGESADASGLHAPCEPAQLAAQPRELVVRAPLVLGRRERPRATHCANPGPSCVDSRGPRPAASSV